MSYQIFQPVNPEIEGKALAVTKVLVSTLHEDAEDGPNGSLEMKGLTADIVAECIALMKEPEKSQAIPASKAIAALIGTTCM